MNYTHFPQSDSYFHMDSQTNDKRILRNSSKKLSTHTSEMFEETIL